MLRQSETNFFPPRCALQTVMGISSLLKSDTEINFLRRFIFKLRFQWIHQKEKFTIAGNFCILNSGAMLQKYINRKFLFIKKKDLIK